MSIQYLKKQAYLSPAFSALLAAGAGAGAGKLLDIWQESNGHYVENKWGRPIALSLLAASPFLAHGFIRSGLDKKNGKHTTSLANRWLTSDQEYEKNPVVNYNLKKEEYDTARDRYIEKDKYGNPMWAKRVKNSSYVDFNGITPDPISVNAFNQTTWVDASQGRTPLETAGLMTGTLNAANNRYGGGGFVTPGQVVGTLINAGIGYGTSKLVGKTLGAMAGISQSSQDEICRMGTWGGMLSGLQNTMTSNRGY